MKTKHLIMIGALLIATMAFTPARNVIIPNGKAHPRIMAAKKALRNANMQLEHAAHDFGGHRVKAMQLIKEAQLELDEALKVAKH